MKDFFDSDIAKIKYIQDLAETQLMYVKSQVEVHISWVAKEKDKYLSQEGVFQYFDDFEQTTVTKPYT